MNTDTILAIDLGKFNGVLCFSEPNWRIIYNLMRFGLEYTHRQESAYAEQVRERLRQRP